MSPGTRFGPYEIAALIGVGGMGEVYRATDTNLKRDVALKVLPETFVGNADRLARFQREAEVLAALNDPNVAQIYGLERSGETTALVMELVDGPTLAERIAQGPLPVSEALNIAQQIASALEAAHERGIVHRDLKPANILLSRNGVKVLDFGLAKISRAGAPSRDTQTPLEIPSLTAEGSILGTMPYMSPEQVEGQEADARSDIFSFGVVLYELITGRRPFSGKSQSSLIASILKEEPPPLHELQPLTPSGVDGVVRTCLEKDPDKRWQSAREVRHALRWISAKTPSARTVTKPLRYWQGSAVLLALLALGMVGWMFWPKAPSLVSTYDALLPEGLVPTDSIAISPDGRKLVATTGNELWIRSFDSREWRPLRGTEGAESPFWSPDSRYLAFAVANQLKKIDTTGGPPETLCTVSTDVARGSGAWSRDGVILFGTWGGGSGGPIWKVSAAGGAASPVTQVDASKGELYHTWPTFMPDGKHFLYFRSGPPEIRGIYGGSLDARPDDQSRERILTSPFAAAFADGYLFFLRQKSAGAEPFVPAALLAQRFDSARLKLGDAPVVVAEAIQTTWYATGVFSISSAGTLAYRVQGRGFAEGTQLTWIDRQGKALGTVGPPGTDGPVSLSPDGRRAVVKDAPYGVTGDLWTLDLSSNRRTRLTFRKETYSPGVWSPDGTRIAYAAGDDGDTLYEKASSGAAEQKELLKEPGARHYPTSWSADGRFLLYENERTPKTGADVWVLPLEGDRKPVLLLGETYNEWAAVFSPDMRWVAYASLENGDHADVYVRLFNVSEQTGLPRLGESKWQVSRGGGNWPLWPNPNEIEFTNAPTGYDYSVVPVKTTAAGFESGDQERLFVASGWVAPTSDGQRFLTTAATVQRFGAPPIVMVLNWPALLKK